MSHPVKHLHHRVLLQARLLQVHLRRVRHRQVHLHRALLHQVHITTMIIITDLTILHPIHQAVQVQAAQITVRRL